MDEHQAQPSNNELTGEQKAACEAVADTYERLYIAGQAADALELLVGAVGNGSIIAAKKYLEALRMRKAAATKGLRIGV